MSTHDPDSDGEPGPAAEVDELQRLREAHAAEIEALEAAHASAMASLRARHRTALRHLKSSPGYRIGELIVELRHRPGWRQLPSRTRELVGDVRRRMRHTPTFSLDDVVGVEPRRPTVVASILDEYSHHCLAPEVRLAPVRRSDGADGLDHAELFLAETAWRGNEGDWSYEFSRFSPGSDLDRLAEAARERRVPSVMWNKEDPVNYDTFIGAARAFDWVVTTDEHSVAHYRADLGHDRVATLLFAAQPKIHNPIGRPTGPLSTTCFAGAWRGDKYPDRATQLSQLLDAASQVSELVIYDREPSRTEPEARFPARFEPAIAGSLAYREMLSAYRAHAAFLNVNSVDSSPTMLSRRVFEILACRTPVVSTPSAAIDRIFGELVPTPSTLDEQRDVIARLVDDVDHRDRLAHLGYRAVHRHHTYRHRIEQIGELVGLRGFEPATPPSIDAICVTQRPRQLAHALDTIRSQTYPNVRLILVTNADGFDDAEISSRLADLPGAVVLSLPPERTLGECLNAALEVSDAEYFAKFDDDDHYGPDYLADMVIATEFADASVFGKLSIHAHVRSTDELIVRNPGREFEYVSYVAGGTLLVRRADIGDIRFEATPRGTDTRFLAACRESGLEVFSTDRFNYVMHRDLQHGEHTWQITDRDFSEGARRVSVGPDISAAIV